MQDSKEKIKYDIQRYKGYTRMPREILRCKTLSSGDKDLAALIFSYSNTRKDNSTCTRTYKGFSDELGISCATTSRAFKRLEKAFPNAIKQVRRATYIFNVDALTFKSYIPIEHYFRKNLFTINGTARRLSRYAAQGAAITYERFFKDAEGRDWKNDKRQKLAISADMSIARLAVAIGVCEKTAAKALSELIDAHIIFPDGKYKQLNGYFCRKFKPELKLFDAILEVRALKKYKLTEAKRLAEEAERERKAEREDKIAQARRSDERYKPLFKRQSELMSLMFRQQGKLTEEQEQELDRIEAEIKRLDEINCRSG